ncbi:carbon-nitrogen hydrolase family protein [Arthrobacter agilis]|uniref:carbon-nitrogen hydrolase family protein n=1 Tax=Arthrobacter agilis TaxID=37921 RepID=UPI000B35CE5E|nr:carbon-nitrogen hydrolase family protein [Arthrobacter agilis]OUM43639.1 carbon-nitrogen hydrolase [Arthrobacter agilis]PPB46774.1 carbon-nitrogen hydrolase [Arthrobacter agilis]TPV24884.1 carbon-nitrogen hydrolase family protein [Arthrobacter agilis]WDF33643.1 carbon-nitrogen hydrolase family protein [Arthrobacter agilis]VDR31043.1 N-carbamoyl-D-amino acid hydrolase [Arthrobacter agilis]
MLVSVGQFRPGGDAPANLAVMRELVAEAAAGGSELIVFPEESMFSIGKVEGPLQRAVEENWTSFVQQVSFMAAEHSIAVVAGGYESSGEERPFNTLVLIDATGRIVDTYRKLHLYDAFSYQESTRIKPGDGGIKIADLGGIRVGLMTCYDIRFPEQARALADAGADLICVPAAWFKGDHKIDHWETLLRARAIENTLWVAAAGTSSAHTIGHSAIIDPMGIPQAHLEEEERGVVTTEVTRRRVEDVREFLPVLRNRRFARNDSIVDSH